MKKNLLGILIVLFFYNTAAAQQKMELVIPKGHSGGVKNLLVTSDNHYLVSGGSGLVNIYDLIQNKLLKTFNLSSNSYNASASQIVFNKSQTKLLCSSKAGLFIINLDDLSIKNIDFTKATTAIFSTDESKIYTAGKEGAYEVKIYNGESKKLFNNTEDEIANVRLAKDGKAIYFAGENKLYKFNVESQTATLYSIPNMMDVLPNDQFYLM